MDPKENTTEVIDEQETEVVEQEVTDDELLAAMDEELAAVSSEAKPQPEPVVEDAKADDVQSSEENVPSEGKDNESAEDKAEPELQSEPAEEKPAEAEKAQEEPEPEPKEEAKPSDEFGTLEDSVPEKTRERFETIKTKYDDLVAERDAVKAEADQWVETIKSTGTNPEQFGMALTWLKKLNSKKPEDLEDAYGIMQQELEVLGKALGKPLPGRYDPLDEYTDLREKVDDGLMDEAAAQEVAQARAIRKLSETSRKDAEKKQNNERLYNDTLTEVRKFGEQLQASDPHFQAKMPYLEPIISAAVESGAPPEKWLGMIEKAYSKIPNPTPIPAPQPVVPDPIRPGGTSPSTGSLQREPGSELEAVNQALERGW